MYKLYFYSTQRGDVPAAKFIRTFPDNIRGKINKLIKRLEEHGPNLPRPYSDTLRDKIRELRVNFGNLDIRLLYFFSGSHIIITHGFCKKTQRTPDSEIHYAINCMNDFMKRGVN
jgi:phage-related protein